MAPENCVQYFTGTSGSAKTYNFGLMLQNQAYSTCVRQELGYCSVEWSEVATTSPDPFLLGAGTDAITGVAVAIAQPALIQIPGSVSEYYSGTFLSNIDNEDKSGSVLDNTIPFSLQVRSEAGTSQVSGTGYYLTYVQKPC